MAPVFGLSNLGRRLAESVVGLFAILGFVYVPLGHHTGFEHAKAVFSTPAAASAIEDLTAAAVNLRQRVADFVTARLSPAAVSDADPTPPPSKAHAAGREPRPVPPKLK
jgi:hypothetical protein